MFWDLFKSSMVITLTVSVVAVVGAYPVAYFLAFCVQRRRYTLLMVLLAPFFTSYLLRVIAWQVMLNNDGVINSLLWELHLRPQGDAISWLINTRFSVGLVLFYSWVPFVALPMFVVLENLDRRLIEAAQDLGANRWSTFLRVTFPLSLPGVVAGFVFVLIPTTGEFITPLLVGGPSSYMFGNAIQQFFGESLELELRGGAGALAGRRRGRDAARVRALPEHRPAGVAAMTGVGRLGRTLLSGYFGLLVVFLYVPLVVLVIFAFNDNPIQTLPLSGFTTKWFHQALSNGDLTGAIERSAWIAALNGLAATLLGTLAALGLAGRRLRLRPLVTMLVLLPLVVPYLVLAIGMLILLHQLGINASLEAVLAGHIVISLPYAVLVILPRLRTLEQSIVEAARDLGANELEAFMRVTLPLLAPALVSSFLIAFTISFDEFAIAYFLAPAGSPTYPVFLYSGTRAAALVPEVIATGAVVIAFSMTLVVFAEVGRRWAERRLAV